MKTMYEWEVPKDHPNFTGCDGTPDAYRVLECKEASGGIIIEARWRGVWEVNSWNTRALVRHLLQTIDRHKRERNTSR